MNTKMNIKILLQKPEGVSLAFLQAVIKNQFEYMIYNAWIYMINTVIINRTLAGMLTMTRYGHQAASTSAKTLLKLLQEDISLTLTVRC